MHNFRQEQEFSEMNCETNDCPICFDVIGEKNNIVTECGHQFHASCLMTNITRNGFGCPCCRTVMAETDTMSATEVDDDTEIDYDDEEDDDEEDDEDDDDALRGFRLFANRIEGIENDQEDLVAEFQYNESTSDVIVPTIQEFTAVLRAQGVTYEQLVANAMMDLDEYTKNNHLMASLDDETNDLWEKMRTYINNYSHGIIEDEDDEPAAAVANAEDPVAEDLVAEDPVAEDPLATANAIAEDPICDLAVSPIQQFGSSEFEFLEDDGFNIADPCYMTDNWRDMIWSELDLLWADIESLDYKAQPMIHI
jgi:hypothetical protein